MFKVATTEMYRIWLWDDEDMTGEVFALPRLRPRKITLKQLREKYPRDPNWKNKLKVQLMLAGRHCPRTIMQTSKPNRRRSKWKL